MRGRVHVSALGVVMLAACGSGGQAAEPHSTTGNFGALANYGPTTAALGPPVATGGGSVADVTVATPGPTAASTADAAVRSTDDTVTEAESPTVEQEAGNRLLMIGDSIMAATDVDNGGAMCAELVPRGWQVGMDAVGGRHADVGAEVTRARLVEPWDAAVVALGSNYEDDAAAFAADIRRVLDALAPRPVLVVTVSEFETSRAEVNYVLRESARGYANVRVLEWSEQTRADESLTGEDGLHLNDRGIAAFAAMIGGALGDAPGADAPGVCLALGGDEVPVASASGDDGGSDDDGGASEGGG
ncbi:MAG: hypothetical protein H0W46_00715 [Acidimicrobiia bacterium]|nr:hypothetical protein [Acidimicrobiia bacterium]